MAYYTAIRTERDIAEGRAGTICGTQFGAAWPTIEHAERSRPWYAVEFCVIAAISVHRRKPITVLTAEQAERDLERTAAHRIRK